MTELAYSYDSNGDFVSAVKCQPCKIRLGYWLLPAKATWVKPPEQVDGKVRSFNGVKWIYKDVVKAATLVEPHVEKSVEVRDNPDLVRLMVDNMRSNVEKKLMQAAGAKFENLEKDLSLNASEILDVKRDVLKFRSEASDFSSRVDSIDFEIGVLNKRVENLVERFETLISEVLMVRDSLELKADRVRVVESDESVSVAEKPLDVAAVQKKSVFKFWS